MQDKESKLTRMSIRNLFVSLQQSINSLFSFIEENSGAFENNAKLIGLCEAVTENFDDLESFHEQHCDQQQREKKKLEIQLYIRDNMIVTMNECANDFAKSKGLDIEYWQFIINQIKDNRPSNATE
jgi:hypothetical protein